MRRLSIDDLHYSLAALRVWAWCVARRYARQPGQGLVEYSLVLILIAVVCVGAVTTIGNKLDVIIFSKIGSAFK